jgi:uncharacterized protein
MKIQLNQIPAQGLVLKEEVGALELDLGPDILNLHGPLQILAKVSRISNAVSVDIELSGEFRENCSRCLEEFNVPFRKRSQFNYPVSATDFAIDLNEDIREELVLDYPLQPICRPDCQGLCVYCGKNQNEGKCGCQVKS